MKAAPFEYVRAATLAEACALLAEHGPDAKLIAGGQSLVPMMAMRLARPAWLVDINRVDEMKHIAMRGELLCVGAGVGQRVLSGVAKFLVGRFFKALEKHITEADAKEKAR